MPRNTVVVRILKKVHDKAVDAMPADKAEYMDKTSWLSYLVSKGLENVER